jgi:hypothetical protein
LCTTGAIDFDAVEMQFADYVVQAVFVEDGDECGVDFFIHGAAKIRYREAGTKKGGEIRFRETPCRGQTGCPEALNGKSGKHLEISVFSVSKRIFSCVL